MRFLPASGMRDLAVPITLDLAKISSPGGDYDAVIGPSIVLTGQASPDSDIVIYRAKGRRESAPIGRTTADAEGEYRCSVSVGEGINRLTARTREAGGGWNSASLMVNRANDVIVWNTVALEAVRTARLQAPDAARALAIASLSVADGVDAIRPTYINYAGSLKLGEGSPAAAADAAAYTALLGLFPAQKQMLDAELATTLSATPVGRGRIKGVALGTQAADRILALRTDDGSAKNVVYSPTPGPDIWKPTPPAYSPPVDPQWGNVKLFALTSGKQFQPPPPPAPTSAEFAADVAQVEAVGGVDSTARTADQTALARFWSDLAGTFDPPGHWNQIADIAALAHHSNLTESARMLALVDMALADAGIEAWGVKYEYDTARPVTIIRTNLNGINSLITSDPSWTPLWSTPSFPSYVSGHSTFSSAAAAVLDSVYGSDYSFTDLGDPSLDLAPRHFANFDAAAQEAGISRIDGGIHFESDNLAGLSLGAKIGRYVISHELLPIKP